MFSAKEAFYKCQYEVTSRWLEFDEVVLDLSFDRADGGVFGVSLRTPVDSLERALSRATGRFCFHAGFALTGIAFG